MSVIIDSITKLYGKQKALDEVSFGVEGGQVVGFLGPNGAGKSTMMKIITCFIPQTSGTVKVCGFDVSEQSIEVRKLVGYLPEHNPLYLEMYVREYLEFIAGLHKLAGSKKTRVNEMIEITGLEKEQTKKIGALSKGFRQRVGLAQALIHDPKVLILDEPTSGLDPNQLSEVRTLIKSIGKEKTVILSTHIMQEVEAICDRVIIINQGKIVADETTEILRKSSTPEDIILVEFDTTSSQTQLLKITGVASVENISGNTWKLKSDGKTDIRPHLFQFAVQNNLAVLSMQKQEQKLEDVFQLLTKKPIPDFLSRSTAIPILHLSTMRLLIFFTILSLSYSRILNAQNISAYSDYRGYLQAFDQGMFHQLEYLPVKSYKVGSSSVAYIDNKNDFKIYYKGEKFQMVNAADFSYTVTDYLVAFRVGSVLYVFDNGVRKTLSYYTTIMTVNDSVLVYFDDSNYNLSVYYQGKSAVLESSLLDKPKSIKTGSNTVAWVNQSNYFSIFYQGQVHTVTNIPPLEYAAGQDIVAYTDDYDKHFHLFYKGDSAVVEEYAPDSFKVGYGIMAYVDNLGNFRVFNNGATKRLLSDRPDYFFVKGNIVVYSYNRMFNVFYNGVVSTLENFNPSNFQLGINGVAWLDESNRLKVFDRGKTYTASYEIINKYELIGNVLKYETGSNTVNIFFEGKNY